jgi:hypothetical protein
MCRSHALLGVHDTFAVAMLSGDPVLRDVLYNGNPAYEKVLLFESGAIVYLFWKFRNIASQNMLISNY